MHKEKLTTFQYSFRNDNSLSKNDNKDWKSLCFNLIAKHFFFLIYSTNPSCLVSHEQQNVKNLTSTSMNLCSAYRTPLYLEKC